MRNAIKERFESEASAVLRGLGQLDPEKLASDGIETSMERIAEAASFYNLDAVKVQTELRLLCASHLIRSKRSYLELYNLLAKEEDCFGSICKLMKIGLTLPLTSCSAERSFSKLRIIKSRLRSTMGQERLCSLLLMSVEPDLREKLDLDDLVEQFAKMAPRRMVLI